MQLEAGIDSSLRASSCLNAALNEPACGRVLTGSGLFTPEKGKILQLVIGWLFAVQGKDLLCGDPCPEDGIPVTESSTGREWVPEKQPYAEKSAPQRAGMYSWLADQLSEEIHVASEGNRF